MAPMPGRDPMTKVEKYKWVIVDRKGRFHWVLKGDLQVDHEYQRQNINNDRLLDLCDRWSWVACGALSVARRANGSLWVIDGQHRKLAADKRADIDKLPCLVFDVAERADEATGFLQLNTHRGAVRMLDRFNAMVMAGDPDAVEVRRLIEASGYRIASRGSKTDDQFVVRCVGAILTGVRRDRDIARRVWALCAELYAGVQVPDFTFQALFYLEGFLGRRGCGSLTDSANRSALSRLTPAMLAQSIAEAKHFCGNGSKAGAEGVVRLLNKGRRSRRLPHPYAEAEPNAAAS